MTRTELKNLSMSKLKDLYAKDSTRRRIGSILIQNEQKFSTKDLENKTKLTRSAISSALSELRKQFRFESEAVDGVLKHRIIAPSNTHNLKVQKLINSVFRSCELVAGEVAGC